MLAWTFSFRDFGRALFMLANCLLRTLVFSLAFVFVARCQAQPSTRGAFFDGQSNVRFPVTDFVVDVTAAPYFAKGDGQTDDTAAIQQAIWDVMGQHKIVYLPEGTYLISKTLQWRKKNSSGADAWGFNWIQGQNAVRTTIRLKDGAFSDPAHPTAMMWCGGFGSADWFHNYVQDVTFDTGRNNPGAVGLQFYSNNTGAVRNVAIVSSEGQGVVGLDLSHRDMNGPLLVKNLQVTGFDIGIATGHAVNSQTFEHITLKGQRRIGFENAGQSVAIRGLVSLNEVPALRVASSTSLLDSEFKGFGQAAQQPALILQTRDFFARNLKTSGYRVAVSASDGDLNSLAKEYIAGKPTTVFEGMPRSLELPIQETPDVPADDPLSWAIVDRFGADPTGQRDSSEAIQKAIDSGATTVFFPGFYALHQPVVVRSKVRRLLGVGAWLDYNHQSKPDLIIEDGDASVVVLEHFAPINGGIEVRSNRAVVLRSVEARITLRGTGDLFLEDVATDDLRVRPGQRVWARQLNVENEGTHVTNDGAALWILGYKTERGGTLLHTKAHGRSEVFGNFSYTTTAGKLAPMFVTEDASVFAFFNEICFSGDPFAMLVRETRGGQVREIKREQGGVAPYTANPVRDLKAARP